MNRPEQVLVKQTDDGLELALVLDDALLDGMSDGLSLDGFCALAEGVSHLMYLCLAYQRQAQITRLELELQAEIDKFALLLFMGMKAKDALRRLFSHFELRPDVSCPDERARYSRANQLAWQYCRRLSVSYLESGRKTPLLRELRHLYRMGGARKLDYVVSAACA